MTAAVSRRTLLGRLAGNGWFSKHGEVPATTALAVLFEDEALQTAFLHHLEERAGVDLTAIVELVAEVWQQDRGRLTDVRRSAGGSSRNP